MLNALRRAAGSWVAKSLLVLLVLSFGVWGISGRMIHGTAGGNSVITVGSTTVSASDYRLAWNRQINLLSQQFGQQLTRQQATAFGIDEQVLQQLAAGAVLDEQARDMRLGVSKDRLAQLTVEDAAFFGPDGRFDRNRFNYVLNQVGMRQEDYFRNQEQAAVRQQIVEAVSDGIKAPDVFLRAVSLYRGEDRTVDYLELPRASVEPIEDPSADTLASWFEARKASYAAPEYRKFSYVKLEPEDIADETAIAEDDVRKDYEANKAKFTTPESRTIEQIVFTTTEQAETALASIRSGGTFEQAVAAQKKTMADALLGSFTKDRISDKAVADAAFTLPAQQVSDVVNGAFGPVLLRVTNIVPEKVESFEAASAGIRRDLALAEANRILLDVHDSYEDARAGGATLTEAAEKLKLSVKVVDAVDRNGQRPDESVVADLPQSSQLIAALFESEPNTDTEAVTTADNGYVFFQVDSVTPARDRTLDEVREKAVADWKAEEGEKRLAAKAADTEKRLKDGSATLDVLATELSVEKKTKRGLKRGADDADFGKAGVNAVFAVAENATGTVASPNNGAQLVFKVVETFEPAASGPEAVAEAERSRHAQGISNDLLDQLVAQLQSRYPVAINRDLASRSLTN